MKPARGLILWWLRMSRYKAITLPPFGIYALPEHLDNEPLRRHEQEHWRQYQANGAIKFYAKYLWFLLRHGYWNSPWEVAARQAERNV